MTRDNTAELTAANDGNLFGHASTLPRRSEAVGATLSLTPMLQTNRPVLLPRGVFA